MSSDPRFVVITREDYDKLREAVPLETPPELDYVVIAPPPPAEEGKTDLGVYLTVEIAGAHLSSINSGTLGPSEIIEALYHVEGYLRPLQDVALSFLLRQQKDDTGAMIVAAGPNEVLQRWVTDSALRLSNYVDDIYGQAHNPGITRQHRYDRTHQKFEERSMDG